MARTILEIQDEMIAGKVAMSELNSLQPNIDSAQNFLDDLTSASKVAVWRTMFFVVSVGIWTLEKLLDAHKAWVEARALELIVGNVSWYARIALEFQYGDALVFDGKVFKYPTVNTSNQIVKLVAINEIEETLLIKVASLDGSNDPIELTVPEFTSFKAYMHKRKFAGTDLSFISRTADLLRIQYRVYIDPLVMNLSGELISNPSIKPVEVAINNYCKQLPFNGEFSVTQLTDKIQMAAGVVDPVYQTAQSQYGVNPFVSISDYYQPNAGYLKIDPSMPLSTSITYIYAT